MMVIRKIRLMTNSSKNNFLVNKFYTISIALSIFISLDEFTNSSYLG